MRKRFLVLTIFALSVSIANAQPNLSQPKTVVPIKPAMTVPSQCQNMTSLYFLKISGIQGDSRDTCHRNEIEVLQFQNTGSAINITKNIESSSPHLLVAALAGQRFSEAVLTVLETSPPHRLIVYKMKNAMISSISQYAGSMGRENVQIRFASLITETTNMISSAQPASAAGAQATFALGGVQSMASAFADGVNSGQLQEIVIVKPLDASSPKLMQAAQSRQPLNEIIVTVRPGSATMTYKLSNVLVTRDEQQGGGASQSETLHLQPGKFLLEYNSPTAGATVHMGWDVKANAKM